MRKILATISLSVLAASAALLCRCSHASFVGGGTEDVNTRVTGMVFNPDRTPASHAQVLLIASDYDPVRNGHDTVLTDTTNEAGEYRFTVSKAGLYNAQIVGIIARTRAIVARIAVGGDTTPFPPVGLSNPGAVKVMLPPSANTANGYMYIPGTTIFAYLRNSSGFVTLDSVPVDMAADIAYSTTNTPGSTVLRYDVQVESGNTAEVWNPGWNYSRKIILNTSSSGADVAGAVTNFPVLVRLTVDNFDFTQAKNNGEDIRFSKADGSPLPFEIERWDPAAGLAEVWVKVDTVYGNDSVQSLIIYWGNGNAAAQSSSAAVFDTAAGFAGVWHLGEKSGGLFDATADHYNGARNGNQTQSAGCIGSGQFFKDSGDFTDMGNVCNPDTSGFSVCAWIKPVITKKYQTIVSKSPGGSPSSTYGWLVELDNTGALMTFIATGAGSWGGSRTFVLASAAKIVDSTVWHYVAAVFDRSGNGKCKVYLDGADVSSLPAGGDIASLGAVVNTAPLRLGADANGGCPWKGCMDECSVSLKARSTDWIRLCYMNQKQDDKLTIFR